MPAGGARGSFGVAALARSQTASPHSPAPLPSDTEASAEGNSPAGEATAAPSAEAFLASHLLVAEIRLMEAAAAAAKSEATLAPVPPSTPAEAATAPPAPAAQPPAPVAKPASHFSPRSPAIVKRAAAPSASGRTPPPPPPPPPLPAISQCAPPPPSPPPPLPRIRPSLSRARRAPARGGKGWRDAVAPPAARGGLRREALHGSGRGGWCPHYGRPTHGGGGRVALLTCVGSDAFDAGGRPRVAHTAGAAGGIGGRAGEHAL